MKKKKKKVLSWLVCVRLRYAYDVMTLMQSQQFY